MSIKLHGKHPKELSISDFTYDLPEERIAKYPLIDRDRSKLLIYQNGEIGSRPFHELPELLNANDCLVFNDTKVIHARIHFQRETGAHIEILCLEPLDPVEVTEAFGSTSCTTWKAMVGNGKRWKIGEKLTRIIKLGSANIQLHVELKERLADAYIVEFCWNENATFSEILDNVGILPLPPYLNRDTEEEDEVRYQTVYAQADGSVAAPTAGLHFTKNVFDRLSKKQVKALFVTLHVGAGTFKPVKSETMQGHDMHQERISVSANMISEMLKAAESGNRIIPIGTTSLRTIESIYWFGVKLRKNPDCSEFFIGQWDPYELSSEAISVSDSLKQVEDWLKKTNQSYLNGSTQLLIAPGYQIRTANALITNFHQPQSTLLLLVAALVGPAWRSIYNYALNNDFRFLSFGDSSILFRD